MSSVCPLCDTTAHDGEAVWEKADTRFDKEGSQTATSTASYKLLPKIQR